MGEVDPQLTHGCFDEQIVLDAYEHTIAASANHRADGQRRQCCLTAVMSLATIFVLLEDKLASPRGPCIVSASNCG